MQGTARCISCERVEEVVCSRNGLELVRGAIRDGVQNFMRGFVSDEARMVYARELFCFFPYYRRSIKPLVPRP